MSRKLLRARRPLGMAVVAALAGVTVAASWVSSPASAWNINAAPARNVGAVNSAESDIVTMADGRIQVFVELSEPAAAVVYAEALNNPRVSREQAEANAVAAGRSQVNTNLSALARLSSALSAFNVQEVYRVERVLNGISVFADKSQFSAIAKIAGVKRVIPIEREYPTSSQSVPLIGTPNVWANTIGLPAGADGTGIRIGVIDTGVDYLHPNLGGTGTAAADYNTERSNTAGFTTVGLFPTAKVVGGADFAGDAYTGSNAPVPDVNPMDCGGHGSHVSGTAAGLGMTTANATFAGPYDANLSTYSGLAIAPGTAPKASLYGLRVFGCFGSTGLTVSAINWAMDPNGDSDFSDHLDVINMSLGSSFGSPGNASSLAADNAAAAGVIVVASAGNSGDTFFISGSPGAGSRVIATAATLDGNEVAPIVQVNAPAGIVGNYFAGSASFGAALTASGTPPGPQSVVIALDPADGAGPLTTDGCSALTNAAAVVGKIALIDRGTCGFTVKVKNAQNAGAVAVIIADNVPGTPPPGLGGADATITIPSVRVTLADANTFKANIATLNVTLLGPNGGDTAASFTSRGPRRMGNTGILRLKPDIAAPGVNIVSMQTGNTCLTQTSGSFSCTGVADPSGTQVASRTLTLNGTSMASPHIAGIMALLRQLNPTWTVEELKALVMNYATQDVTQFGGGAGPRYNLSRIGAGRTLPAKSAAGKVVAFNADDTGLVSVTFTPEVASTVTEIKKVHVVNKGSTSQTFDLTFDTVVDAPGVSFSLPGGNTVTVPAGQTVDIDVQMSADATLMDHTRDPSLFATQGVQNNYGDQPRSFLTEESAYLNFRQASTTQFRLPLYMANRPASTMSAPDTITTGGAPTGSTTIPLSGTGVCTGTLAAGPTCTGTFPTDSVSLVSPFELGVVSARNPTSAPDYADIRYVGTSYFQAAGAPSLTNDLVMFGIASWGDWSTMSDVAFGVCVDNNTDGVYDKILYNVNPSIFVAGSQPQDTFVRVVQDAGTGGFSILGLGSPVNLVGPNVLDTATHQNNVLMLAASPSTLGFASTAVTSFRYKVVACPGNSGCARTTTGDRCSPASSAVFDAENGPFTYNWAAQGVNFGGNFLDEDLNGNALPVSWNTANLTANGSKGALLLHHFNKSGTRAEVVALDTAQRADLAISQSFSSATPAFGSTVTLTLTATNNGPNDVTGVAVTDILPVGLTYQSDNGAGAFSNATATWTIPGTLANGASATLEIQARVDSTDQQCNTASIGSTALVDTNPSNDISKACVLAPRSSDLALSMTVSSPTVLVGAPITYSLQVRNTGVDSAYSLNVLENFPSFPALNPTTFTTSQGVYAPATGIWNLATLGNGATATLDITLNAPNMAGTLANQGAAASANNDPNTANNTASASTTVLSPADVSSTLVAVGPFVIGNAIGYTATITNSGTFDQQDNPGSEYTLVLPAGLTLVSATATSGTAVATIGTGTVDWNGVVAAGSSVTVTINAAFGVGTTPGTIFSAQATANVDLDGEGTNETSRLSDDPAVGGASDPTAFTAVSPATISGTKTRSGSINPNGTMTYTVVLSNSGIGAQFDNPGDEFTDVLPSSLTLTSASATAGTASTAGNTVSWNGSISAGSSVTITINATIGANTGLTFISNQGTIRYDNDGDGNSEATAVTDDPAIGGVSDPTDFFVRSPATIGGSKSVSGDYYPGGTVTYTITLTNVGLYTQFDNPTDEFIDVLPSALTLVSATASSGTAVAAVGTNTVTWNGSIPTVSQVTITIAATINAGTPPGPISNQGTVQSDVSGIGSNTLTLVTDDPAVGGPVSPTIFMVAGPADVSGTKTVNGAFMVGGQITYTIVLTNSGAGAQADNAGSEFVDLLPAGVSLTSASATSGIATADIGANSVIWNGSIATGTSVTITIQGTINGSAAGTQVINQGQINYDALGNGTNNAQRLTDDPGPGGSADPTAFTAAAVTISTLSPAMLATLALLILGLSGMALRRQRA